MPHKHSDPSEKVIAATVRIVDATHLGKGLIDPARIGDGIQFYEVDTFEGTAALSDSALAWIRKNITDHFSAIGWRSSMDLDFAFVSVTDARKFSERWGGSLRVFAVRPEQGV